MARPGVRWGVYEHVLLPTDGSENASEAADHAIEIACESGATLHVLSVIETRIAYDSAIVDPETVQQNLREEAEEVVEAVAADASSSLRKRKPSAALTT